MDGLLRVLLTNAVAAGALAAVAWLASSVVRRPGLVHALWLLSLLRLVMPPLVWLPILPAGAALTPTASVDGGRTRDPRAAKGAPADASPAGVGAREPRGSRHEGSALHSDSSGAGATFPAAVPRPSDRSTAAREATASVPVARAGRLPAAHVAPTGGGPVTPLTVEAPDPARLGSLMILVGAVALLALSAWRHARFSRLLRSAEAAPWPLAERARVLGRRIGLRRPPPVRLVNAGLPPMLWPTGRGPQLLLPRDLVPQLSDDECDALLVHELAHVRRRDHWVRWLEIGATALFWWYPLAWWTRRGLRRAEERCCDEWVLRALPRSSAAYARALLKCAALACDPPLPAGASGVGPVRELESRLEEILMTRPSSPASVPARAALACIALAGLTVFPAPIARSAAAERPAAVAGSAQVPAAPGPAAAVLAPALPLPAALVARVAEPPAPAAEPSPRAAPSVAPEPVVAQAPGVSAAEPLVAPAPAGPALAAAHDAVPAANPAVVPSLAPLPPAAVAPVTPSSHGQAAAAKPAAAPSVIRISVERVQLDAVITDKKGRHVTDLTPADIEIYQDGRRQAITELRYVRVGARQAHAAAPSSAAPGQAGVTAAAADAPSATPERTILIVVDDLGLSPQGFDLTHRALKHQLARLAAADRVDIVATSRGFSSLSPTVDRKANLAAVTGLRRTPWTRGELSQLLAAQPGGIAQGEWQFRSSLSEFRSDGSSPRFDGGVMYDLNSRLALQSIAVVKQAVRALRDLPGRKALLFISEGVAGLTALTPSQVLGLYWPLDRLYGEADDLPGALKRLAEFAARASVVIDTVDPRGLVSGGLNAEDRMEVSRSGQELVDTVQQRRLVLFREQSTLQYLADQTGGLARLDSNDISGAVASVIDDLSGYYLIGYEPPAGTFDSRGFRTFELKVKRPGLRVRARKGFYAVTDEQLAAAVE